MLSILVAVCAIVTTFTVSRYYLSRTRLVETEIEKVIARKFSTSERALELGKLREENAVMRNLLLDLVENETLMPISRADRSKADFLHLKATKVQRYREILAESVHFLQRRATDYVPEPASSPVGGERRS